VGTDVFQCFLNKTAKVGRKSFRQLLILENAARHNTARLHCHYFQPKFFDWLLAEPEPIATCPIAAN